MVGLYDVCRPLAPCIAKASGARLRMQVVGGVPRCGAGLYTGRLHRWVPLGIARAACCHGVSCEGGFSRAAVVRDVVGLK